MTTRYPILQNLQQVLVVRADQKLGENNPVLSPRTERLFTMRPKQRRDHPRAHRHHIMFLDKAAETAEITSRRRGEAGSDQSLLAAVNRRKLARRHAGLLGNPTQGRRARAVLCDNLGDPGEDLIVALER